MSLLGLAVVAAMLGVEPGPEGGRATTATNEQVRQTLERGLGFLERDALKWRKEHECATCHHGAMTVWALAEAKGHGYAVGAETLADFTKWTKDRWLATIDQPRDSRPGWNLVNTAAIYLAVMSQSSPALDVLSLDERRRIADHVARHQEADGSWLSPPYANGPPPVWESAAVRVLWADLALRTGDTPQSEAASVRSSREKAAEWLRQAEPGQSTHAMVLRLLAQVRVGKSMSELQPAIDQLLAKQHSDGGWGQIGDLASDAFATGQALYVLNLAGVRNDRAEIEHGVAFLVKNQNDDGSWPMKSRAHPGAKPFTNPVPITYFGSAWAVLGIVRSVPAEARTLTP